MQFWEANTIILLAGTDLEIVWFYLGDHRHENSLYMFNDLGLVIMWSSNID